MLIVLVSLKSDINFKLNRGLNLFKQGSKLYPHSVIGNLLVRVYSWDNEKNNGATFRGVFNVRGVPIPATFHRAFLYMVIRY